MPRETKIKTRILVVAIGSLSLSLANPLPPLAYTQDNPTCEVAAVSAAKRVGVPASIMRAITTVETGNTINGHFGPWAWTVNAQGRGVWFSSKEEAIDFFVKEYRNGVRNIDVGCFQINYRWHGHNFSSLNTMFDPIENAMYAARFLKQLHAELGDWSTATGAYHSRTQQYADQYLAKVRSHLSESNPFSNHTQARVGARSSRANTFPLFRSNTATSRLGSLVPDLSGSGASIFARP